MTREEDLRERTYKGGTFDLSNRVSHTLTNERMREKAFAWLVNYLHEKKIISTDDIDTMLLDAVGPRTY
jgi:hypothetical protein